MMMAEYIERGAVLDMLKRECSPKVFAYLADQVNAIPAADVRPVVLCRDCKYYVPSGEADVERMCVRGAEWCAEVGCYYGFTDYTRPDYFCADGEKREES